MRSVPGLKNVRRLTLGTVIMGPGFLIIMRRAYSIVQSAVCTVLPSLLGAYTLKN